MWVVVAAFCSLQLWVLMGLLPATVGGLVAVLWAGLAALTLAAGVVALRRHPDAGALLLGLVLPVTLIPPFIFGRDALPLLTRPLVQLLTGATLSAGLVAVVLARRDALAPSSRRSTLDGAGSRPRRKSYQARLATLVLAALWLALPVRALLDTSLVSGRLAAADPIWAKETLLLVAWAAASLIGLAAVLPSVGWRADREGETFPWGAALGGGALAAVWGLLLWVGA